MKKFIKVVTVCDSYSGEVIGETTENVELPYTPSAGVWVDEDRGEQYISSYYTPEEWDEYQRQDSDEDPDPEFGPTPEDLAGY